MKAIYDELREAIKPTELHFERLGVTHRFKPTMIYLDQRRFTHLMSLSTRGRVKGVTYQPTQFYGVTLKVLEGDKPHLGVHGVWEVLHHSKEKS